VSGIDVNALRRALKQAMKDRDQITVTVLRTTLAAIANAEAVDVTDAAADAEGGPRLSLSIEQSPVGAGATEVDRRVLTEEQVEQIVRAEAADRRSAVAAYERAGQSDRADRLRSEISVLEAYLP
jgi:uncharacterized protein YqeY